MVLSQLQFPPLTRFLHIPTQVFFTYEILVHLKMGVSNKRHLATNLRVSSGTELNVVIFIAICISSPNWP